jgi:hypothetical protein
MTGFWLKEYSWEVKLKLINSIKKLTIILMII